MNSDLKSDTTFKPRVLLIDQNETFRKTLGIILGSSGRYKIVNDFPDLIVGFKSIKRELPDIVFLDADLPNGGGITGIKSIKELNPRIEIIMLAETFDDTQIFEALKVGASGYLLKGQNHLEFINALDELIKGGAPMSSQIARFIIRQFQVNSNSPLTDRESQILNLLALGKNSSEIAEELAIARDTSKTHIRNIYSKLKVNSKSEALRKAREERLIY